MDRTKAERIYELRKKGTSMRRVAEIIEDEFPEIPELRGNQLWGKDLIYEAIEELEGMSVVKLSDEKLEEWGF